MKKSKAGANAATSDETSTSKLVDTAALTMEQHDPLMLQSGPSTERRGPPVKLVDESEVKEVDSGGSLSNSESLTNVSCVFPCHLLH